MPSMSVNAIKFDRNLLKTILERAKKYNKAFAVPCIDETTSVITLNDAQMEVFKEYLCSEDNYSIAGPKIDEFTFKNPGLGFSQIADFEPDEPNRFVQIQLDANQSFFALPQAESIKRGSVVAIDFGTSSTVVAYKDRKDIKLLRLGVEDWTAPSHAEQFENPTLFQIDDNDPLQVHGSWKVTKNRPSISLLSIKHANMAKEAISDVFDDTAINPNQKLNFAFSIIQDLKSKIHDDELNQKNIPLYDVMGKLIHIGFGLSAEESNVFFDAVEYYAWLIGRNINLHFRGYFPKYYLSYPVKFTQTEQKRLRDSFERGIRRSLPPAILFSESFSKAFEVRLFKPEPIAFAASILGHKNGIMLDTNVANSSQVFAIFDIGGGTTDFFYGKYRVSSGMGKEEDDDFVLETYKRDGLGYLGGEHLLHHIIALIFEANQDKFREFGIQLDIPREFNQDRLLAVSHLFQGPFAVLNKLSMMHSCRHLLTLSGASIWNSSCPVNLMSGSRECTTVELDIPYENVYLYIKDQLITGVNRFLVSMKEVVEQQRLKSNYIRNVKVIRSGNVCRSLFLKKIFNSSMDCDEELSQDITSEWRDIILGVLNGLPSFEDLQREAFKDLADAHPRLEVLPLLEHRSIQEVNPTPNLKTGTAIGILKLVPGGGLMHLDEVNDRFELHLGRKKLDTLEISLKREMEIDQGDWVWVVKYREGGVTVYYSNSPLAEGIAIEDCSDTHVEVGEFDEGELWARAVGPTTVEFAVTANRNIKPSETSIRERITLSI